MVGFSNPWVLLFLLLLPICWYVHRRITAKKKQAAIKFSNLGFIKSALGDKKKTKRSELLFYLSLLVLLLLVVGMANPHVPLERTKEGVNVVLVMDVSGSMQATDYQPTRLEAAKRSAEILLRSLKQNDHAGIVIFESGATTAAYLNPSKKTVIEKLQNIAARQGNTAIGDGLSLGVDMATSIPNKKKVLILLSDGDNNAGVIPPEEAVAFAQVNGIQVHTIGMGSEEQVVLGYDFFGRAQIAQLNEELLQAIAQATGGDYYRSVDDATLEEIYSKISEDIEREKEDTNIKDWFIIAAILVLLFQLYLRYGGKRIIQ